MMEKNKKITPCPDQNAATNAVSHRVFQQNRPYPVIRKRLRNGDFVL
jgi:hypothetical protein